MLKKGHAFLVSLIVLSFITFPFLIRAQNVQSGSVAEQYSDADYQTYPEYQLRFKHLDWELSLDPATASGQGLVRYQVEPYPFAGDTLTLQTLKTEIQDVRINDTSVDYFFNGDSLLIPLSPEFRDIKELSLVYTFGSEAGLYRTGNEIVFTSMLPGEVAHYLPGVIHPRTRLTASINVTVPSGYSVVLPGKVGDVTERESETTYQFAWENPHSITDMNFATGKFKSQDTYLGVKKVHLHFSGDQFSDDEIAELLRSIYSTVKKSERIAGREYPFESLQIVILPDAMWETKQSSAGFGYLFLNRPIKEQIALIVAQQWLGAYVQPETWSAAHQLTYPISLLYSQLLDDKILSKLNQTEPEADHLLYKWAYLFYVHEMAQELNVAENEDWRTIFEQSITDLISQGGNVITQQRIQDSYYQQAGRLVSSFDPPEKSKITKDTLRISVNASLDDQEQTLYLTTESSDSLITAQKDVEISFKGRDQSEELTIGDTVTVSKAALIDNVYTKWTGVESIQVMFEVQKPFRFWVDDLRNGTTKDKIKAAKAIAKDTAATDRELLLSEQLKRAENAEVTAALLLALSEISGGALGTEERYLNAVRSEENVIKRAAILSFRKYEGNDQMIYELKKIINSNEDPALTEAALYSLLIMDSKSGFDTFIQRKLRNSVNSNTFYFAVPAVYAQSGDTVSAISYASQFDDASYEYPVRAKMVNWLLKLTESEDQLLNFAKEWVNDSDPRLRYYAFNRLRSHNKELFNELASERTSEEQDLRVLQLIASH